MGTKKEDPLKEATSTLILGKPAFIDNIRKKYLIGKEKGRDTPALKELTKISLEAIIKTAQEEFEEKPELARKAAIYISHRYSGRSLRKIGREFGIGESAVSQGSRRMESEMNKHGKLRRRVERIRKAVGL